MCDHSLCIKNNEIGLSSDRPPGQICLAILASSGEIFNAFRRPRIRFAALKWPGAYEWGHRAGPAVLLE
jgi:hypothetical protein